ncbi:MAG: hypothetical protein DRI86_15260 [Bacteroidetes bacterium]|nr:MAG: hypothetical protein DRI86_15260 [Bacteroidota bacterium]
MPNNVLVSVEYPANGGGGDFKMDGFKFGYGAGLRLLIDEATSSVLRFNISFREDGHSIFIGFNEAF